MKNEQQCQGFLLSCDKNREKQAIKDAYNFLTQYIETLYGDLEAELVKKEIQEQGKEVNLQNEMKYSNKVQNKLLYSLDTNCLIFVKINSKYKIIDPNEVVQCIMKDIHENNTPITRYCHKIMPVEKCFKAQHFKMLDTIDQLFQKRDNSEIKSWALNFKCRNNSKFNYKEILGETEKIAKKYGHFVDIYYPQWTISVEIAHHLMCVSICEKYKDYKEFKLRRKPRNDDEQGEEEQAEIKEKEKQKQKEKNKRDRMMDKRRQKIQLKEISRKKEQFPENQQKDNKQQLLTEKIEVVQDEQYDII